MGAEGEAPFEGHDGRDCGEHRTTGMRAWCYACSEWCYPEEPCHGCERPMIVAELGRMMRLYGDGLLIAANKQVFLRTDFPRVTDLLVEAAGRAVSATGETER